MVGLVTYMADIKWQFRPMSRAEINQESMEREFFQEEPINVRLAREVIQNSLDAASDKALGQPRGSSGPVRVRFSLAGVQNPLSEERAQAYFVGLEPHLKAIPDLEDEIVSRLDGNSLVAGGVPYLVIEDDRTIGLNGNWEQFDDSPELSAEGNDFYWFFRNVGRSGKRASDNGSWGLGKWVFPDASKVSAYIAVTRRSRDDDVLLMGQAVLNKHDVEGQRYPPYGYFAAHDDDGFQHPLTLSNPEHRPFIRQCISDFDLRFRNAPGLSVVIPFPRVGSGQDEDDVDKNRLLAAVIHNYFYPIISGQLEVTVDGAGSPEHLSSSTIGDIIEGLDLGDTGERSSVGYRKLFNMCRDISSFRDDEFVELDTTTGIQEGTQPYSDLVALRPKYESGELLAFRIGTDVQRKNRGKETTSYSVYLQRDPDLAEGHDYYVRGTLSIPNMDFIRRHSARALLVVNEVEPLAAMLRDSEPPSHNAWRPQVERVTKQWVAAPRRIESVRRAPATLLRILEAAPEGLQRDALLDIFSWDGKWGRLPEPVPVPKVISEPRVNPSGPSETINRQRPDFSLSRIASGFRVTGTGEANSNKPFMARVRVAYAVPRGNPFKRYTEHDFRLHGEDALRVEITGGIATAGAVGNELLLDIANPSEFRLSVEGFDQVRDVRVSIDRIAEGSASIEEQQ